MHAEDAESQSDLIRALSVARGHFLYESGHHGELWLDLNTAFVDVGRTRQWARMLAARVVERPEVVCGPMLGGAWLAQMLALELGAAFVFVEQVAGSDGDTRYRVPQSLRPMVEGKRVLLVDDAVNAGSAWRSTLGDLRECKAQLVGFATLLTLGDAARRIADEHHAPLIALAAMAHELWKPEACPLCRSGAPLSYELIRR